jgi:hypothetical protein
MYGRDAVPQLIPEHRVRVRPQSERLKPATALTERAAGVQCSDRAADAWGARCRGTCDVKCYKNDRMKRMHLLLKIHGVERHCGLAGAIEAEENNGDAQGNGYGFVG